MIAQYVEIKTANPDCLLFYRMGDFYELFFEDAEIASRALGIVLTKRGRHLGEDIAMCGVPVERADDYLQRLIRLGHRVAVCEQTEDPAEARKRGAKSVVRRDVVRLVTPGTITEDMLLEPRVASILVALARVRAAGEGWLYGIAGADISTGVFQLRESDFSGLASALAGLSPSEIVAPSSMLEDAGLKDMLRQTGIPVAPVGRDAGDSGAARARIAAYFGISTLDGMGQFSRAELAAGAVLLVYVELTQIGSRPMLSPPVRVQRGDAMEIDAATRANLELTRTLSGQREGSLVAVVDGCMTAAGSRLLQERLAAPLVSPTAIEERLDSVAFFIATGAARAEIRKKLGEVPDFVRALGRLALDRGGPRDIAAVRDSLAAAVDIARSLECCPAENVELRTAAAGLAKTDPSVAETIGNLLAGNLPLKTRDGEFIQPGREPALDEARQLRDESRRVVAALQSRYADETGNRQLRIKHNHFLGYYIEVAQAQGERLTRPPFDTMFVHRQTMAGAMRFSTKELAGLDARIASAAVRALELELGLFDAMVKLVCGQQVAIKQAAQSLSTIDVAANLAEVAVERNWRRPKVDGSLSFSIEAGRHPVVEAALRAQGKSFVANDSLLSDTIGAGHKIAVVTGPNMAGKSTFLRQNALICVLAQSGSFVPASAAHIGVVDRLFSRVGASDDLARGLSTFMVEMVETAAILNQATPRSFVILDEIGRGTATYDGLSIAWATMEHLHNVNRSRGLFATHFHELTQLSSRLPNLVNLTMRVADWNGDLVFLHEVVAGAADRSYGIQVAKLAGLPRAVVDRAKTLLAGLEAGDRRGPMSRQVADLPLFAMAAAEPPPNEPDLLAKALDEIDPDALTPRSALEAVYALKALRTLSLAQGKPARKERN